MHAKFAAICHDLLVAWEVEGSPMHAEADFLEAIHLIRKLWVLSSKISRRFWKTRWIFASLVFIEKPTTVYLLAKTGFKKLYFKLYFTRVPQEVI